MHHRGYGGSSVPTSSDGDPVDYTVVSDLPTLAWAANLATLEFHVPLWHVGPPKVLPASPDHMVFDLDPGEGRRSSSAAGSPGTWSSS